MKGMERLNHLRNMLTETYVLKNLDSLTKMKIKVRD